MGLFRYNDSNSGVDIPKDSHNKRRFFLFFELFFRKLGKLSLLNILYFITLIPFILGMILSFGFNEHHVIGQPMFLLTGDVIGLICIAISIFITGPSTAGFTYVIRNFQRSEHAWLWSDFREHFAKNFKQGVVMGIIDIAAVFILYTAYSFYLVKMPFLLPVIYVVAIIFIMMHFYIYVIMVTFDLKLIQIIKNALIFAIAKLPMNIFITVIDGAILALPLLLLAQGAAGAAVALIFILLILLSLVGFLTVFCVYPSIDKHMISQADDGEDQKEL